MKVCQTDQACVNLVPRDDSGHSAPDSDSDLPGANGAVCYKGGYGVKGIHQMCDVTSAFLLALGMHIAKGFCSSDRKILDMLPDRKPQVTFACDLAASNCGFQFWIGKMWVVLGCWPSPHVDHLCCRESFYCKLDNCTVNGEITPELNTTAYECKQMECSCIPGRMLCGEDGSVGEFASLSRLRGLPTLRVIQISAIF